jgi:6-phosphogluconolactonase
MSVSRPVAGAAPSVIVAVHADLATWVAAAVTETVAALRDGLAGGGRTRLLVSGGGTPGPIYRALATQALDWARVDIALVDERWLPVGDPDSNARLIQETLLTGQAAIAHFQPMLSPDHNLDDSVRAANLASTAASVALLGMGPDGHTASLFPGMRDLDQALASADDHVAVDAAGCPGAQGWPRRISMTPHGLSKARQRLLLIRGEHKRALIERALDGKDSLELPVRALLSLPGAPLHIHWCP